MAVVSHSSKIITYLLWCMVNKLLLSGLRWLGLSHLATKSLAILAHHICMKYGVSIESYANSLETPLFGPGQGSTPGPFLWLLCCCLMLEGLHPMIPKLYLQSRDKISGPWLLEHLFSLTWVSLQPQTLHQTPSFAFYWWCYQFPKECLDTSLLAVERGYPIIILYLSRASRSISHGGLNSRFSCVKVPRLEPLATFSTIGAYVSPSGKTKGAYIELRNKSIEFAKSPFSYLTRQDNYWAFILHLSVTLSLISATLSLQWLLPRLS